MNIEKELTKKTNIKSKFLVNVLKHRYPYGLILPSILLVFVLSYVPMIGILLAFKDFVLIKGIMGSDWVGMDNFLYILKNPLLLKSISNTLIYGVVLVFVSFPFPIILALLFNELSNLKFKKVVQTISYMPYFLSWISVVGLFYVFLAKEGPMNTILAEIFGKAYEPKNILLDANYFLPILFTSNLWKNMGWSSVVFLAAIAGIDQSLYEAAIVDGCSRFKRVFYVTLPSIKSTMIIILVMSLGNLLSVNFEQVYGFQNVFTQKETDVISTVVYRMGIQNGKYSLATAFGLIQGLASILLILTANGIFKRTMKASLW